MILLKWQYSKIWPFWIVDIFLWSKWLKKSYWCSHMLQNFGNPSSIDLSLTNRPSYFQQSTVFEIGLSDFHLLNKAEFKTSFQSFDNKKVRSEILKSNFDCTDLRTFKGIVQLICTNWKVCSCQRGTFYDQRASQSNYKKVKINPWRPNPGLKEKINLNVYFHTSLWCLKRFYEGLKGLHKTFWDTTKKCENKNLS